MKPTTSTEHGSSSSGRPHGWFGLIFWSFVLLGVALGLVWLYHLALRLIALVKEYALTAFLVVFACMLAAFLITLLGDLLARLRANARLERETRDAIESSPFPRYETVLDPRAGGNPVDLFFTQVILALCASFFGFQPAPATFPPSDLYELKQRHLWRRLSTAHATAFTSEIIMPVVGLFRANDPATKEWLGGIIASTLVRHPLALTGRLLNRLSGGRLGLKKEERYRLMRAEDVADNRRLARLVRRHISTIPEAVATKLSPPSFVATLRAGPDVESTAAKKAEPFTPEAELAVAESALVAEVPPTLSAEPRAAEPVADERRAQAIAEVDRVSASLSEDGDLWGDTAAGGDWIEECVRASSARLAEFRSVLAEEKPHHPDPGFCDDLLRRVKDAEGRLPGFADEFFRDTDVQEWPEHGWGKSYLDEAASEFQRRDLSYMADWHRFERMSLRRFLFDENDKQPTKAVAPANATARDFGF